MKSILISIKPEWVAKILNYEKFIEIRKTMPKCDFPIDVYIYCTKGKPRIVDLRDDAFYLGCSPRLNGKVVAKFTLNKVEEIKFNDKNIQEQSCLSEDELFNYLFDNTPYQEDMRKGYAWHIDNLEIFDKPKELKEFYMVGKMQSYKDCQHLLSKNDEKYYKLTKAPQNYVFIETEELK